MNRNAWMLSLLLATGVASAEDAPKAKPDAPPAESKDAKELSGMSVLGNQEAPKALVLVPWKSSEIGDSLGIATMLDDSKQPVDKEVFLRALSYYQIRSTNDAAPSAVAAHRR
jgi:hypothetical protein